MLLSKKAFLLQSTDSSSSLIKTDYKSQHKIMIPTRDAGTPGNPLVLILVFCVKVFQ